MCLNFDPAQINTPCYVVDASLLVNNLKILKDVADRAKCKILLAQKAFSMYSLYKLIGQYLDGTSASGLHEARLGYEEMGGETHVHSTAYRKDEFGELLEICDCIVFNSFHEWEKYRQEALSAKRSMENKLKFGIRLNPEFSTQSNPLYDPCAKGSRLGTTIDNFRPDLLDGLDGFHFHTLCEQNSDALVATVKAVEEKFGNYFSRIKWINLGGGHYITRDDYDIEALIKCITRLRQRYGLQVYLEPGEAIALNAGFLVTSVLDMIKNSDTNIAILDASAACHISEVLELQYKPDILGAGEPCKKAHTYTLAGPTCFACDVIGEYSFDEALKMGDRLIIKDMATYTMVKNNTFNGMKLPSIAIARANGQIEVVKQFGYDDFKSRLS